MIGEWSSSHILKKMISEPQTGIKPTTFWWLVRHSNHWATKTQMESQGASSTYMCDWSGSHYILIMIGEIYKLDIWELGNILRWWMNDCQALYSKKTISEPQRGIEPTTFWWLVRHSNHWATKTQMESQGASLTYMCDLRGSHYILIMIGEIYKLDVWELGSILRW